MMESPHYVTYYYNNCEIINLATEENEGKVSWICNLPGTAELASSKSTFKCS